METVAKSNAVAGETKFTDWLLFRYVWLAVFALGRGQLCSTSSDSCEAIWNSSNGCQFRCLRACGIALGWIGCSYCHLPQPNAEMADLFSHLRSHLDRPPVAWYRLVIQPMQESYRLDLRHCPTSNDALCATDAGVFGTITIHSSSLSTWATKHRCLHSLALHGMPDSEMLECTGHGLEALTWITNNSPGYPQGLG